MIPHLEARPDRTLAELRALPDGERYQVLGLELIARLGSVAARAQMVELLGSAPEAARFAPLFAELFPEVEA